MTYKEMDKMAKGKNATLKVVGGLGLMIGGALGLIFGRNVKSITLRVLAMAISVLCLVGGAYLFKQGLDERAIGRVGAYKVGGSGVQSLYYKSPEFFKAGVQMAAAHQPTLRRLHFQCPDLSKEFTVYITAIGILGIPGDDVICKDGFPLVTYDIEKLSKEDRALYLEPGKRVPSGAAKTGK